MSRPKKNNGPPGAGGKKPSGKDGKAKQMGQGVSARGGKERKKGFQVGPAHAAKNAYLGKAKKIKAELIMKSKLKKSYAKVVQEEGIQSGRLKSRNEAAEATESVNANEAGPSEPRREEGKSSEAKERGGSLKRKFSGKGEKRETRPPRGKDMQRGESSTSTKRAVRALSPGDIGPPMPQSSLKELKKEAFAKYHPAQSRSTTVSARGSGRSVSGGSIGSSATGGKRGQPNMGARMGFLLEKIKRDRS